MTENESTAIKICRVLCIFFMSYVHVNPGPANWGDEAPLYLTQISSILSDILGRASVPALSVLGGYLAVSAYRRRSGWWMYAKERFQALLLPLMSWNIVIICLSIAILFATGVETSIIRDMPYLSELTPFVVIDKLSGFNYGSATTALNFLRDIFICALLLPLCTSLFSRVGIVGLGVIWMVGLTVGFAPLIMRPNILMFFTIGVYFALQSGRLTPTLNSSFKVIGTLVLTLALTYFIPNLQDAYAENVVDTILRLIVASGFLVAAMTLSKLSTGKLIAKLEPYAYLMFLSHATTMLLFWGVWQKILGNELQWPYLAFYILAPFAAFGTASVLHRMLAHLPSFFQQILNGRKITRLNKPSQGLM